MVTVRHSCPTHSPGAKTFVTRLYLSTLSSLQKFSLLGKKKTVGGLGEIPSKLSRSDSILVKRWPYR